MTSRRTLINLPNEILLMIWKAVLPGDIDNFAITCRDLRALAGGLLEEHKRLKAAHTHISLYEHRPSELILSYCVYGSRLAHYPKIFTIFPIGPWSGWTKDDQAALRYIQIMGAAKREFLPFEMFVSLMDSLNDDALNGAMTAIAARGLPNLEKIIFIEDRDADQHTQSFLVGLVGGIMELTTLPVNPRVIPPFSRLRMAEFRSQGSRLVTNVEKFLPLLALPNLRSFEAIEHSCCWFVSLPFPPRTSKVEILNISTQKFSEVSMATLLSAFDALKSIKFSITDEGQGFFPAFHLSLLKYCQHSLQRLEIHDHGKNREFFGYLHPFSVLQSVIIQPDLLFTDRGAMPRLTRVFPRSIREINFTRTLTERQDEELFTGFLEDRQAKLPHLRCVVNCQLLDFHSATELQQGSEYCFRYVKYYNNTVSIRVIDANSAKHPWKLLRAT